MKKLRYAVEQRLRFIDFLLNEYGYINRSAITDYFDVSLPQATRDLQQYKSMAPKNAEYSSIEKVYRRTRGFKRIYQ